ncbi:GNAT family N-acetyltransferase [Evansella halocellulosilytica]|uniref:GNAT family N-acetyltransferase n=1 Tax=Evansella halocellulosilytica TaxID=2011013 RepID=UPI000BB83E08|nr:GNAT family N-acetyltransferase [Evansella halocellulosilytica]
MNIRDVNMEDIPDVVPLMEQLGYPASVEQLRNRFTKIIANKSYHTFIADLDGKIVALAGLCTSIFYEHDGYYVRIVAFVVDENYRGKGIGKQLLQKVEEWAKEQGAIAISLNTGTREERQGAHQFYMSMGFEPKSIGFSKEIE